MVRFHNTLQYLMIKQTAVKDPPRIHILIFKLTYKTGAKIDNVIG